MKKIFKKYKFLKYAIVVFILDLLTRNGFEFGGGAMCLVGAIVAICIIEMDIKKATAKSDRVEYSTHN